MSTEISRYLSNQYEESNHCGKDNNDYKHYGNMQESLDVVHQDSPPVPHGKIQRWTLYMHTPYAVKTCFPKGFTKPAAPPLSFPGPVPWTYRTAIGSQRHHVPKQC